MVALNNRAAVRMGQKQAKVSSMISNPFRKKKRAEKVCDPNLDYNRDGTVMEPAPPPPEAVNEATARRPRPKQEDPKIIKIKRVIRPKGPHENRVIPVLVQQTPSNSMQLHPTYAAPVGTPKWLLQKRWTTKNDAHNKRAAEAEEKRQELLAAKKAARLARRAERKRLKQDSHEEKTLVRGVPERHGSYYTQLKQFGPRRSMSSVACLRSEFIRKLAAKEAARKRKASLAILAQMKEDELRRLPGYEPKKPKEPFFDHRE